MSFTKEYPPISVGADISVRSFEMIRQELRRYPRIARFTPKQQAVIERLIHTTTCFDEILEHIYFTPEAVEKIQSLLQQRATIVVDVNMIKSGISDFYLKTYGNEVVCYINEPFSFERAKRDGTTRSYAAVVEAVKRHKDKPMLFICGNAPTFIYAAVNTLLDEKVDLSKVGFLLFPVGFVNVVESKAYAKRFCEHFQVPAVIMQGRFGSSTMGVAALHAIYRLIKDYDGTEKYNGK